MIMNPRGREMTMSMMIEIVSDSHDDEHDGN